jgi:hypothetical protein
MRKPTVRLTIFSYTHDDIQVHLISDHSGQQIVIVTTMWWLQKLWKDKQRTKIAQISCGEVYFRRVNEIEA